MIFLRLAFKSIRNRSLTSLLTILSIALSVALLLSVEKAKRASEEGFTQSISQVDLIVGARTGPISLLLYTVFNMGSATNNISLQSYEHFKKHPAVEWTIPYSLGDGHGGFRVVGTTNDFYEHYRFRGEQQVEILQGKRVEGLWDVVLGSDVAKKLNYQLGQKVVIAHGVTKGLGIQNHDDKPFTVVGIMKPTGTALDRSLYISLEGLEALHMDWKDGAAPTQATAIAQEQIQKEKIKISQITAFFLRTKSRIETLRLQREINTYEEEPLLAIIPGVALSDLWRGLGYFEQSLKAISWMVVLVGLVAMLIALLTSLNERRREMAILRSLGAPPSRIVMLLVFESALLTLLGIGAGIALQTISFSLLSSWLESNFGLYMTGVSWTPVETFYMLATFVAGVLIGFVPAIRSMKLALKDGLSIRI